MCEREEGGSRREVKGAQRGVGGRGGAVVKQNGAKRTARTRAGWLAGWMAGWLVGCGRGGRQDAWKRKSGTRVVAMVVVVVVAVAVAVMVVVVAAVVVVVV